MTWPTKKLGGVKNSENSYEEFKEITDKYYTDWQMPKIDVFVGLLDRHGIKLRKKDGELHEATFSVPKSMSDALVLGLRYYKKNETFSEDLFLFCRGKSIQRGYRGELEKVVPEYRRTHKGAPNTQLLLGQQKLVAMINISQQTFSQINFALNSLKESFIKDPDTFLTEEDLRCHLFMLLQQTVDINKLIFNTIDQSKSIPLHTEIRWYGDSGKLKYRSDIVILDPRTLRTTDKITKLPSKGYGFNSFWAIIELKLRRINGKSDNQFLKEIKTEFNKLRKIKEETWYANKYQAEYYLLCFDKKKDIGYRINNFNDINETERINLHYVFK